mmetsp:Transcript_960/g.3305  ORF Transcript_960/g.3305 Transcript_960/m.3305 type:complete len:184 (-) Transcript_960:1685-2236(-)
MPTHKRLFHQYLANPRFAQKLLSTLPYSAQSLYVKSKFISPKLKKRHLKALKAASEKLGLDASMIRDDFSVKEESFIYTPMQNEKLPQKTHRKHGFIKHPTKIDEKVEKRRVKIDKIVAALKIAPVQIYGHKKRLREQRRKSKLSPMRFSRIERQMDKLYMNRRIQHNAGRFHKTKAAKKAMM